MSRLIHRFATLTGTNPDGIWSAPGRANLIGEHLDYNGGVVAPFALPLRTTVAAAARSHGRVRCWSEQESATVDVALDQPADADGWGRYVAGTVWALGEAGWPVPGVDLVVDSEVPTGGGLGSSAALTCAVALAVSDLCGTAPDRMELARACQRAEHEVAKAPVGLMDQVASLNAEAGRVTVFDSRSETIRQVPWMTRALGVTLLIADTRTRHAHASGDYSRRRGACESAAAALGVAHLAEVSPATVDRLAEALPDPMLRRRARHVITEQDRVHQAVAAIAAGDMPGLGRLLTASHRSLRDDFEVSTPLLDDTVDACLAAGALGARLTGGGFGGCVLALVPDAAVPDVERGIRLAAHRGGHPDPDVLPVDLSEGARREM